jgi:hypothetical protein
MSKAAKLKKAAKSASEVRAYQTDPDVVALRVEVVRTWVDRLVWTGMVLGLLFTMANVQSFASQGTARFSVDWFIAWLLDPMVSLVLIGVLMGEQVINRHNVGAGGWVRVTKWVALGCTYGMNTWSAYAAHSPAKILLHSVPPLIVVCAAEAVTDLRMSITKAVTTAYEAARTVSGTAPEVVLNTPADTAPDATRPVSSTVPKPVPDTAQNTPLDTTRNTAADTTRPVSDTRADTAQNTPPKRVERTRPQRVKGKKNETREEAARRIYDAHMAEQHEVISNAALREELRKAGHPTGNRTAADLLVEFKAHPLRLAN